MMSSEASVDFSQISPIFIPRLKVLSSVNSNTEIQDELRSVKKSLDNFILSSGKLEKISLSKFYNYSEYSCLIFLYDFWEMVRHISFSHSNSFENFGLVIKNLNFSMTWPGKGEINVLFSDELRGGGHNFCCLWIQPKLSDFLLLRYPPDALLL